MCPRLFWPHRIRVVREPFDLAVGVRFSVGLRDSSSVGRAPVCHTGGRLFESGLSHHLSVIKTHHFGVLICMCQNEKYRQEIMSQKWGKLTALEFAGYTKKHRRTLWKCLCDCGNEVIVRSDCLRSKRKESGSIKSCGCAGVHRIGSEAHGWVGHGEISGSKWTSLRLGAKSRKLAFDISIEYAWELFLKQNRRCALSNRELFFTERAKDAGSTASLDRIDSSKGYIEGNVQWLHQKVNVMKMAMTTEEFIGFCQDISRHHFPAS